MLEDVIEKAISTITQGGIILYPSDTIWGLGCHAANTEAIEKIHQFNNSNQDDIILLVDSEKRLEQYIANPPLKAYNLIKYYEKPITILYNESVVELPEKIKQKDGRIAIRVVNDAFCRFLINELSQPLVFIPAASKNETDKFPGNFEEINDEVKAAVDYVVPFKQDIQESSSVSKMIRFNEDNEIEVVRD